VGEAIKVAVRFPDGAAMPDGARIGDKIEVKVMVEYRPQGPGVDKEGDKEKQTLTLGRVKGSWGAYDATLNGAREGRYRFWLVNPDVRKTQPDGEHPSASCTVELPPRGGVGFRLVRVASGKW
jgi:hypothetical protein